jgi:hypothetical protein
MNLSPKTDFMGSRENLHLEPCDHGVEYEADVRPQRRLTKLKRSQKQPKTGNRKLDRDQNNALWMRSSVR